MTSVESKNDGLADL